ncbi:hypothetical protein PPE_06015 [Paenibacillus polymyxa E681]|nr:hypothetical protein PPE_06015 [Paenibacillus polymyxa E681]
MKNGYISVYIRKIMKMKAVFNVFRMKISFNFHDIFGKIFIKCDDYHSFIGAVRLNVHEK